MKTFKLADMKGGWFVGDFEPSLYKTKNAEVAIKTYKAGSIESSHYHKQSDEITVIISGSVLINDKNFSTGDIIYVSANECIKFQSIEDSITVVYKSKSVKNDKFSCTLDDNE